MSLSKQVVTPATSPVLFPEAARKIAELNTELAPADPTGETRLRNVYDWSVGHAGIAFDVLSLIPRTAPFSPLVKLIIGVALLSAGAGEATDACRKLMNRLISIHLESLPLRKPGKDSRIDQEMDIILAEFHEFILPHFEKSSWTIVKAFKKDLVLGKVNDWTSRINVLQQDYVVPSLRMMKETLDRIADQGDRMEAKVEALQQLSLTPVDVLSPLENLPDSIDLIGRERDLNLIFDHLSQKEEHLSLVGVGGIGKTALAIKVAHHPRAKDFGRPVFIPCERLGTLDLFQATLLRLRAPNRLKQSEDLEQAVRHELEKESLLLILDNLLDTSDASHASYFDYIKTLTTITKLTILITSRNHSFKNIFTSRAIHPYVLDALSPLKSKQLFLRHYRTDEINLNDQDRIDLKKLLDLLSGLPLAIRIVAVYARGHGAGPLANVIVLWKQGVAWDTGLETRDTSVDLSLRMSFSDVLIKAPGTLGLLRLLAGLPQPILARRGSPPGPISKAITAIVERSVGQRDIIEGESYLRILGPVREYILRHHPELDFANDAVRAITIDHLKTTSIITASKDALDHHNIIPLIKLASGPAGDSLEPHRLQALLSCVWDQDVTSLELRMLLEVSVSDYIHLIRYRLQSRSKYGMSASALEQVGFNRAAFCVKTLTGVAEAVEQAKQYRLYGLEAEALVKLGDGLSRAGNWRKACTAYKEAGDIYFRHQAFEKAASSRGAAVQIVQTHLQHLRQSSLVSSNTL